MALTVKKLYRNYLRALADERRRLGIKSRNALSCPPGLLPLSLDEYCSPMCRDTIDFMFETIEPLAAERFDHCVRQRRKAGLAVEAKAKKRSMDEEERLRQTNRIITLWRYYRESMRHLTREQIYDQISSRTGASKAKVKKTIEKPAKQKSESRAR